MRVIVTVTGARITRWTVMLLLLLQMLLLVTDFAPEETGVVGEGARWTQPVLLPFSRTVQTFAS